jgi:TolA-binding protein
MQERAEQIQRRAEQLQQRTQHVQQQAGQVQQRARQGRAAVQRLRAASASRPSKSASGSNAFLSLMVWALIAGGIYWLLSDDGREIRALVAELLESLQ